MVEFISYDGEWPCLCSGTLGIKVNGKPYYLDGVLISGGCVSHDDEWNFDVTRGPWELDLEEYPELMPYEGEILNVVNENVEWGCCGGCI